MPTSSPDPRLVDALAAGALRAHGVESLDPLVGLTAGEAEASLDQAERTVRALERQGWPHDLGLPQLARVPPWAPTAPRPTLLARLWTRLRQAGCGHAAATAHRVPGFGPGPVFERRCGRCGAAWSEYG